jgi:hypothetical protein
MKISLNRYLKQKCLFLKMEDGKIKQVLSWGWYQWEGAGYKEKV